MRPESSETHREDEGAGDSLVIAGNSSFFSCGEGLPALDCPSAYEISKMGRGPGLATGWGGTQRLPLNRQRIWHGNVREIGNNPRAPGVGMGLIDAIAVDPMTQAWRIRQGPS
jgi:hypothetical protein